MANEREQLLIQMDETTNTQAKERPSLLRMCFAELIGTMVVILFGNGCVAQAVLSKDVDGSWFGINVGFGLGVTLGMLATGSISGAHLNPAVTVALAAHGKCPKSHILPFSIAQIVGAMLGSCIVYLVYYDAIRAYDGGTRTMVGPNATVGLFATYPQPYLTTFGGIVDQFTGTAVLMAAIFAMIDDKNGLAPPAGGLPFAVGALVCVIGISLGMNSGYAINPARDLGPRIFSWFVYGSDVWVVDRHWAWIPAVVPFFGGLFGSTLYRATVWR